MFLGRSRTLQCTQTMPGEEKMELPQVIVALDLGKYKHVALVYNTQTHSVCKRVLCLAQTSAEPT